MSHPGARPVQVSWDKTPETGMLELVLRIPVRPGPTNSTGGWSEDQKRRIGQVVVEATLFAVYAIERDGIQQ